MEKLPTGHKNNTLLLLWSSKHTQGLSHINKLQVWNFSDVWRQHLPSSSRHEKIVWLTTDGHCSCRRQNPRWQTSFPSLLISDGASPPACHLPADTRWASTLSNKKGLRSTCECLTLVTCDWSDLPCRGGKTVDASAHYVPLCFSIVLKWAVNTSSQTRNVLGLKNKL